ncbi:hypothetical protein RJ41_14680, partial [Alteromonas marina]
GDYRLQSPTNEEDTYTYSSGVLVMDDALDYVLVNGDFVIDTSLYSTSGALFSAGVLEVKGNFTQLSTYTSNSSHLNFKTSGTHKVVLSGSTAQDVYF